MGSPSIASNPTPQVLILLVSYSHLGGVMSQDMIHLAHHLPRWTLFFYWAHHLPRWAIEIQCFCNHEYVAAPCFETSLDPCLTGLEKRETRIAILVSLWIGFGITIYQWVGLVGLHTASFLVLSILYFLFQK